VALALALGAAAVLLRPEAPPGPVGGWMAAVGVAPRFATIRGVQVRYVRRGTGAPVVLIHGFASSLYTWKDVLPALAEAHDVVALDLPAHGGSQIPATLAGSLYPEVVLGLLDTLALPRAALVGNSLGGAVAVSVAAHHPERVDRLVLIDSAGFNFAPRDRPALLRLAGWRPGGALLERLPVRRRMVALGLRQVFHDDTQVQPAKVDEYVTPLLRPGALRALGGLLAGSDALGFPGIVEAVRAPTLVVWGRQDAWIPASHAGRFAAAIPGARVALFDGCGHMPQEECPGQVAPLLREFLAFTAPRVP
jgi:pimeloyl-ACP methyl ester carboxylesterase